MVHTQTIAPSWRGRGGGGKWVCPIASSSPMENGLYVIFSMSIPVVYNSEVESVFPWSSGYLVIIKIDLHELASSFIMVRKISKVVPGIIQVLPFSNN